MSKAWSSYDPEFMKMFLRVQDSDESRVLAERLRQEANDSYKKQALYYMAKCQHLEELLDDASQEWIKVQDRIEELQDQVVSLKKEPAPPQREPLTDEQMRECAQSMDAEPLAEGWDELIKFARAIERAHGIGEKE